MVKTIKTNFTLPKGVMRDSNIRFNYSLGGGGMMDLGCMFWFENISSTMH